MAQHLRNLTLASAKHLLSQGHITKQHHDRIVRGAGNAPTMPKLLQMPKGPGLLKSGVQAGPTPPGQVPGLVLPPQDD